MSFGNSKKSKFIQSFPTASIELKSDTLAKKAKFNLAYFDNSQDAGQDFPDWTFEQVLKLLEKLQGYSKDTLDHWTKCPIGKGKGHVLEIYGAFPKKSEFTHPKHVPHQAIWGRFRLERSVRLIGFTIPENYNQKEQNNTGYTSCSNTFYIVFLDKDHKFYNT